MTTELARRHFTVDEYHKMAEAGILGEDDRIELIAGEIVEMSPIGRRHVVSVDRLNAMFAHGLHDKAITRVQSSVILGEHLEPQPDLVLLRWRPDFYAAADAGPEDVLLIVDVADSSLDYDCDVKVPLYARAGIPETWIADLNADRIVVYREPGPDGYRVVRVVQGEEGLRPQAFQEFQITARQIIG